MNVDEIIPKKRRNYVDMVKGISILTLVFLHFEDGYINTQYNFFLVRSPAFYMIVGWLWGMSSSRRSIKEHWKKRKNTLIVPYLWFSLIFLLFDVFLVLIHIKEPFWLWRDIYKTLCFRGIGTLWFLPALLGGELLFIIMRDKKIICKILLFLGLILLLKIKEMIFNCQSVSETLRNTIDAPLHMLSDALYAFIFICIAYYISLNAGKKITGFKKSFRFFCGVIFLSLSFMIFNIANLNIIIANNLIFNLIRYIFASFFAGIGIMLVCMVIEDMILLKPLVYFGKNSLILMATHFSILLELAYIVDKYICHHNHYYGITTIYYFIAAIIFEIGIIELINRKFKFIIGK